MADKLVAPVLDRLLNIFDRRHMNPSVPSAQIKEAVEPLFSMLKPLSPLEKNDEVKQLWLRIPRGTIDDYDSYEDMLEWEEVQSKEEYEERWHQDYPDDYNWYSLVAVESRNRDGSIHFRAVSLGDNTIVSADLASNLQPEVLMSDDAVVRLCNIILPAIQVSLRMLREDRYNELIESSLPYKFRTGVIKRSVLNLYDPDYDFNVRAEIQPEILNQFRRYLAENNNEETIGRIDHMTANDFFHACSVGYHACGFAVENLTEVDQYFAFGDGRDEGLTGRGHGLNAGRGIDSNDPSAWEQWYFHRDQHGGHPWEVLAGGNSTHMDLVVYHDRYNLEWRLKLGQITQQEAASHPCGYYFVIAGKHRPIEAIQFYVALRTNGFPVVLRDAKEILARFDASDYIGIVPHHVIPKYCESLFPAEYGHVIDFIHVYDEDMDRYGNQIKWLPEPKAKLQED